MQMHYFVADAFPLIESLDIFWSPWPWPPGQSTVELQGQSQAFKL